MRKSSSFKAVLTAMFSALVCVMTICIQIASPLGGYVNLGDAGVLLGAYLLGPVYGAAAAGIGSALADILTGYAYYAPGTLIIKAAVALIAALLLKQLESGKRRMPRPLAFAIPGIIAEIFMVLGYFVYAWIFLGYGSGAIASVPGNIVQALVCTAIACLLTPVIEKPREIREMTSAFHNKK